MLLIANWKMNGSRDGLTLWARDLTPSPHTVVLCPPFPLLDHAMRCASLHFSVGGQDCHTEEAGAYTGSTSALLLREMGCGYVILGHSERRFFGETNVDVNKKAKTAMRAGIIPIICLGENRKERDEGAHLTYVADQVKECTKDLHGDYVIAYEPIWAIGTGKVCDGGAIAEMHSMIHALCPVPIVYGGSVNPENIDVIKTIPLVSGVLVGGASLDIDIFNKVMCG